MNLQRCGTVTILFLALILISLAEGSKKKKKVIVKVPARIKHIYHHHTKNLHIHKPRPSSSSYDSPRARPPIPYSGSKKRSPPWREEKSYDDYYEDYDYGNYGYGGWVDEKARYKEDRSRYKDEKRGGGYDYEVPKRGRWREEEKKAIGYSGYSKRSPQWKNSRRNVPKKYQRDMYEGAGTAPWPEVKEHESWHQQRPQGFQQNTRIIPADQYHDTSIHAIDYTEAQPSNYYPSIVSLDRAPSYNRQVHMEPHPSEIPLYQRPQQESLHHPPPPTYNQPSAHHGVEVEDENAQPTSLYSVHSNFDQSQTYQPQTFQPQTFQPQTFQHQIYQPHHLQQ